MDAGASGAGVAALAARDAVVEIDASELDRHPGLLDALLDGRALGAIVRGVFDRATMDRVAERLGRGACDLERVPSEYFRGETWGRALIVQPANLSSYFRWGAAFGDACRGLFDGGMDFLPRMEEVLGRLGGGRHVAQPTGPDGRPYLPCTIRCVEEGGEIAIHCENETTGFPSMRHLVGLIDAADQLSAYVTLGAAEQGGELRVLGLRHGEGAGRMLDSMGRSGEAVLAALAPYGETTLAAGVGDLLIFDAGRCYHRVTAVGGSRVRRTMGSFIARSRDHQTLYYWG